MKRLVLVVFATAFVAAACGGSGSGETLIAIRASTDPAVGDDRLLFAVNEIDGTRRGSPDEHVTLVAKSIDDPSRTIEADAEFVWVVPDAFGLYRASVPFDTPGVWQIDFEVSTGEDTDSFLIDVQPEPRTVAIGAQAPLVETPTYPDTPLDDITTDDEPLESLYTESFDTLLANGRPTVVLFATPAYCTSASCGPLLDQMKELSLARDDADFIHVEVYGGFNDPGFAPSAEALVPAVNAFRLPSEPWVFVMDAAGVVSARFEGVLGEGELESVLDAL